MIKVIEAKANDDFSLDLKFNDGKKKRFNARPYLDRGVFRELKAPDKFKQIRIAYGTIQWENGYQSGDALFGRY
jgi:hypothetical protein